VTVARQALGAAGEALAAAWYEANGYIVLDRNWRVREGELDLVVRKQRTIVFCEVKTRTTAGFGLPQEAVTRAKRERIRQLAAIWLQTSPVRPRQIRFDVAAILDGELQLIEGCF
jgi:putative endonuclease